MILLGDFNWDCSGPKPNLHVDNLCDEFSLEQIIEHPTRVSLNRGTLLDVIMTNVKSISHSGCINDSTSDHLPVFLIKKRQKNLTISAKDHLRNMIGMFLRINWQTLIGRCWTYWKMLT